MNFPIIDLKEKLLAAFIVIAAARAPSVPRYVSWERAGGCNAVGNLLASRPRARSVVAALTLCVGVAIAGRARGWLTRQQSIL